MVAHGYETQLCTQPRQKPTGAIRRKAVHSRCVSHVQVQQGCLMHPSLHGPTGVSAKAVFRCADGTECLGIAGPSRHPQLLTNGRAACNVGTE